MTDYIFTSGRLEHTQDGVRVIVDHDGYEPIAWRTCSFHGLEGNPDCSVLLKRVAALAEPQGAEVLAGRKA